ncbi:MAG: flagellar basal body-associated FliL family protein [Leptospira sp.]|nr:flagellar basal body-associated FliL family protein [Leptospira sp.]MCZ8341424.1 flagellar basal body-associated FliL family protein [Leptospira sp.]
MGDREVDEEEGGLAEGSSPAGMSPIVKWLLYIAAAIFGIIIVTVISMFVAQKTATSVFKQQKNISLVKAPPPLEIYTFQDEFRVNTSDVGESHFVKLKMSLGFESGQPALSAELAARVAQMQNIINLVIARKTKDDLKSITNQLDLREEIKAHLNHILTNGKIKEVYFTEFLVN